MFYLSSFNEMKIIPFETYELKTKLSEEEIKSRLQENIATAIILSASFREKKYMKAK